MFTTIVLQIFLGFQLKWILHYFHEGCEQQVSVLDIPTCIYLNLRQLKYPKRTNSSCAAFSINLTLVVHSYLPSVSTYCVLVQVTPTVYQFLILWRENTSFLSGDLAIIKVSDQEPLAAEIHFSTRVLFEISICFFLKIFSKNSEFSFINKLLCLLFARKSDGSVSGAHPSL